MTAFTIRPICRPRWTDAARQPRAIQITQTQHFFCYICVVITLYHTALFGATSVLHITHSVFAKISPPLILCGVSHMGHLRLTSIFFFISAESLPEVAHIHALTGTCSIFNFHTRQIFVLFPLTPGRSVLQRYSEHSECNCCSQSDESNAEVYSRANIWGDFCRRQLRRGKYVLMGSRVCASDCERSGRI